MADLTTDVAIFRLQDEVAALTRERDALHWQPIETIPPDSGWYLAFDGMHPHVAYWAMKPMTWQGWNPPRLGAELTHWMPLPTPPQAQEARDG